MSENYTPIVNLNNNVITNNTADTVTLYDYTPTSSISPSPQTIISGNKSIQLTGTLDVIQIGSVKYTYKGSPFTFQTANGLTLTVGNDLLNLSDSVVTTDVIQFNKLLFK